MEDLGAEEHAGNRQGGAGENGEAYVVVGIVHAGLAVEAFAVEERGAIHQVEGELGGGLVDDDVVACEPQIDGDVVVDAAGAFEVDGAVARDDHGDFVSGFAERGGQCAHHVGQPAGFGQRRGFGRNHQDSGHNGIVAVGKGEKISACSLRLVACGCCLAPRRSGLSYYDVER